MEPPNYRANLMVDIDGPGGVGTSPLDEGRRKGIESRLDYFKARESRARGRLAFETRPCFSFAILGLKATDLPFEFGSEAQLRVVEEPPGEVELARGLKRSEMFSAVGRYSQNIRHELVVYRDLGLSDQGAMNLGWWIVSGLRVRTVVDVLVPAAADHSWDVVSALDRQCSVQLLEDVPRAWKFERERLVSGDDLTWIAENLITFADLLEVPSFRLAVEALGTHHHHQNLRMVAAALWSGVEALFGVESELRFRLAASVAAILEPRGESRKELYLRVKQLYDVRSKAVHGIRITDRILTDHILEVRNLLARLLCTYVERKACPTMSDVEHSLFC